MPKMYRFLLLVAVFWLAVLPLWLWLSPYYGHLLAGTANILFHRNIVNNDEISFRDQDRCIKSDIHFDITKASTGQVGRGHLKFSVDAERFHFNFTVWIALMLATPFERRIKGTAVCFLLGWLVLLGGQSLDLFLQTQDDKLNNFWRLAQQEGLAPLDSASHLLGWAGRYFLHIGNVVLPIVIWLFVGIPRLSRAVAPVNKTDGTPQKAELAA
jgi:hypothetical protein